MITLLLNILNCLQTDDDNNVTKFNNLVLNFFRTYPLMNFSIVAYFALWVAECWYQKISLMPQSSQRSWPPNFIVEILEIKDNFMIDNK